MFSPGAEVLAQSFKQFDLRESQLLAREAPGDTRIMRHTDSGRIVVIEHKRAESEGTNQ